MGITAASMKLLEAAFSLIPLPMNEIRLCEFGNAHIIENAAPFRTGKEWLLSRGIKEHVSIDLNGLDGSLALNLGKPIEEFPCRFDIVTAFGTMEHVSNQYYAFRNVHNFLKNGGCFVAVLPEENTYPKNNPMPKEGNPHWFTRYAEHQYEERFFRHLCEITKYRLECLEMIRKQKGSRRKILAVIYRKTNNDCFIPESMFLKIKGLHTRKDMR